MQIPRFFTPTTSGPKAVTGGLALAKPSGEEKINKMIKAQLGEAGRQGARVDVRA